MKLPALRALLADRRRRAQRTLERHRGFRARIRRRERKRRAFRATRRAALPGSADDVAIVGREESAGHAAQRRDRGRPRARESPTRARRRSGRRKRFARRDDRRSTTSAASARCTSRCDRRPLPENRISTTAAATSAPRRQTRSIRLHRRSDGGAHLIEVSAPSKPRTTMPRRSRITVVGSPSAAYVRPYRWLESIQIGKRIPQRLRECARSLRRLAFVDADDRNARPTPSIGKPLEVRHFGATRRAPRRPEIHHDDRPRYCRAKPAPAIVAQRENRRRLPGEPAGPLVCADCETKYGAATIATTRQRPRQRRPQDVTLHSIGSSAAERGSTPLATETATACLPRFSTDARLPPICARNSSQRTNALRERGRHPKLAILFVGENDSSLAYVRNLARTGERAGIAVEDRTPCPTRARPPRSANGLEALRDDPADARRDAATAAPAHLAIREIADAMPAHKDVDGTHPTNQGHLAFGSGTEYVPATPAAVMLLLERSPHWPLRGRRAVMIGRSIVVGAPVAMLMLAQDATVTILHKDSASLQPYVKHGRSRRRRGRRARTDPRRRSRCPARPSSTSARRSSTAC